MAAVQTSKARVGTLAFTRNVEGYSWSIPTPATISYTKKGSPVHLTSDNVDRLPIDMVAVVTEHMYVVDTATPHIGGLD